MSQEKTVIMLHWIWITQVSVCCLQVRQWCDVMFTALQAGTCESWCSRCFMSSVCWSSALFPLRGNLCVHDASFLWWLWSLTEETLAGQMEETMLRHLDSLLSFIKYDISYIESLQDNWWGRPAVCLYGSRAAGPSTPGEQEENYCHNHSNPPVTHQQ